MKGNKSPGCGRGEQDQVLLLGALVARGFAALCPRVFGEPCFFNLQTCEENLVVPGAGVRCRWAIILICSSSSVRPAFLSNSDISAKKDDLFSRGWYSFVNDCLEQMLLLLSHLAEQAWWHQSYKVIRLKLLNQQNIPGLIYCKEARMVKLSSRFLSGGRSLKWTIGQSVSTTPSFHLFMHLLSRFCSKVSLK